MGYYDMLYNLSACVFVEGLKILETYLKYEDIIQFDLVFL